MPSRRTDGTCGHATRRMDPTMADVRRRSSSPAHLRHDPHRVTAWFGWILFTCIMFVGSGLLNLIQALTALLDDRFFRTPTTDLMIDVNYAVWGWAFLVVGAALIAAGI